MTYGRDIIDHVPMLRYLAARANAVLELGVRDGLGSTAAFSEGFALNPRAASWVSVDIVPTLYYPTDRRWRFVQGDTRERSTLDAVVAISTPVFDVIFIDTEHTYDQMQAELALWGEVSCADTTWVFHDTWMHGRYNHMTDAIKIYAAEHQLRYMDYSKECHGLGLMFK